MKSIHFPDLDRMVNADTAASVFNTSAARLANDRSKGTGLPYLKVGKSVVYDLDACYEQAAQAGKEISETAVA